MTKPTSSLRDQSSMKSRSSTTPSSASSSSYSNSTFLPSCWDDDERMSGLMSMFKRREVNPTDYDAKMRFWTDLIETSSNALKKPIFTLKQLTYRFQRKDRVPAGLETVVRDMWSRGLIVPASEYAKQIGQQGWVSWGVDILIKRPLSWIWGGVQSANAMDEKGIASMEFIVPSVVQEIGEEILRRRRDALDSIDADSNPLAQDVVTFSALRRSFYNGVGDWNAIDDRSLELALNYLQHQRQVAVELSGGQGEKVIKFKSADESGAPRMTESDRQILNVKRATANLEQELSSLDQQVERLDREARAHVRAGNRAKAKTCLRHKLSILKRMKDKETAFDNLTGIMNQLAQTREQKAVFDAYKAGVSAFKGNLARHGLSADNIDKTMDDIQEALSDHEDIRAAIAAGPIGFGGALDSSQEDLEQELNELLEAEEKEKQKQKKEKRVIRLPDVPIDDEDEEIASEEAMQEDRLKRLRRALENA